MQRKRRLLLFLLVLTLIGTAKNTLSLDTSPYITTCDSDSHVDDKPESPDFSA